MPFILLLVVSVIIWPLCVFSDSPDPALLQRIQPVGKVRIATESSALPEKISQNTQGQDVYEKHCVVCHENGIAGAPKFRDEAAWKARLSQKKLNELTASAMKGMNAMPAMGTCGECNEKDMEQAIQYMLPVHE